MDKDKKEVSKILEIKVQPTIKVLPKCEPELTSDPLETASDTLDVTESENESLDESTNIKPEPSSSLKSPTHHVTFTNNVSQRSDEELSQPQINVPSDSGCSSPPQDSSGLEPDDPQECLPLTESVIIKEEYTCHSDESNSNCSVDINSKDSTRAAKVALASKLALKERIMSRMKRRLEPAPKSPSIPAEIVVKHSIMQLAHLKQLSASRGTKQSKSETPSVQKEYKCTLCPFVCNFSSNFSRHKRIHFRTSLTCIRCNKIFGTKSELEQHAHSHKKEYKCDDCDKVYSSPSKLRDHRVMHTENPPTCDVCNKVSSSMSTLITHIKTHIKDRPKPYSCSICSRSFARKNHCRRHLETHQQTQSDNRVFECDVCKQSFRTNYILKQHKEIHNPATLNCSICKTAFRRKGSLERHVKDQHDTSSDGVKHPCTICNESYATKWELKTHITNHDLQCASCDILCSDVPSLRTHMTSAHGCVEEKCTHKCTLCSKMYSTTEKLARHMCKSHENVYYSCEMLEVCYE